MILLKLFISFFKIGLFSFGGGYAMIPFIQKEIVVIHHWLTQQGFVDIVSISQSTPGPVAINSATFVGYQVGGVLGSIIATVGVILPEFLIVWLFLIVMKRFQKGQYFNWVFSGVRPIVVALILSAGYSLVGSIPIDIKHIAIFAISLLLLYKTKINSILLILAFGLVGIAIF